MKQENNLDNSSTKETEGLKHKILALIIGFIFLLILLLNIVRVPKGRLRQYYHIDHKTYNKWIAFFCVDICSIQQFKKQRKISYLTELRLKSTLGLIDLCPPMRKIDIVAECDSDYRTLRKNIKIAPASVGIDIDIYDRLSVFPPRICRGILDWFG